MFGVDALDVRLLPNSVARPTSNDFAFGPNSRRGDEVEQAYRRGTALKKRRELMEMWGRYVEVESNVVALRA